MNCVPNSNAAALVLSHRPRRVTVLIIGIIILSVADLLVTLAFVSANWMMEANPIAAYLIETTESAWVLAAFKAATVGICVSVLYRYRSHRSGEVAAWCAVMILVAMSFVWSGYSAHFEGPDDIKIVQSGVHVSSPATHYQRRPGHWSMSAATDTVLE